MIKKKTDTHNLNLVFQKKTLNKLKKIAKYLESEGLGDALASSIDLTYDMVHEMMSGHKVFVHKKGEKNARLIELD